MKSKQSKQQQQKLRLAVAYPFFGHFLFVNCVEIASFGTEAQIVYTCTFICEPEHFAYCYATKMCPKVNQWADTRVRHNCTANAIRFHFDFFWIRIFDVYDQRVNVPCINR